MNLLLIRAKHNGFYRAPVIKFSSLVDNSTITIESQQDILVIQIFTRRSEHTATDLFLDLFSILYVYLGAFPTIESATFNGSDIDRSNWIDKFKTRSELFRHDLFITDINDLSINQNVIDAYREKQLSAIFSLQYLTCESYRRVIADHKLTLLLHVIDGISDFDNSALSQLKTEMISKYKIPNNISLGKYIPKVYAVSNECFFNYHRKYNCEILQLLKISQYTFLRIVTDTRNWNSHFLRDKKIDRLKDGSEIAIFFEILQYMVRLKIAKDIGAPIKESNVQEYYYVLHDWILRVLYNSDVNLKSNTYKTAKQWDEFTGRISRYVGNPDMAGENR